MKNRIKTVLNVLICILFCTFCPASVLGASTQGVTKTSDENTMDSYENILIDTTEGGYGSRHTGRVWTDKSVIPLEGDKGELVLDKKTDGVDSIINFDEDFLHVYSALGSSQQSAKDTPIDLVMVLDVSGSMGSSTDTTSKIANSINAMNNAIHTVLSLNKENRVGVVLFASWADTLLELDHYQLKENKNYISASNNGTYYADGNITAYKYRIKVNGLQPSDLSKGQVNKEIFTTNGDNTSITVGNKSYQTIGGNTNMDSGFWTGLQMLANNTDTVRVIGNETVSFQPAFMFLGDGDPQNRLEQNQGNWWNPDTTSTKFSTNGFNNSGTIASTIMRAAYMKAAVQNNYTNNLQHALTQAGQEVKNQNVKLLFQTVGIKLGQTSHPYGEYVATAILDPSVGFNQDPVNNENKKQVIAAHQGWNSWKAGSGSVTVGSVILNQLAGGLGVSKQDVINNINYTDKFYNATDVSQIPQALEELIQEVTEKTFTPIKGVNSAKLDDSLTYIDPIGKYMEVKEVTDLTLLGSHYKVKRAGEYSYKFNKAFSTDSENFETGWYYLKTKVEDPYSPISERDAVDAEKCSSDEAVDSNGNWNPGYYYMLSDEDADRAVPTITTNSDEQNMHELLQNATYTIYQISTLVGGNDPRNYEPIKGTSIPVLNESNSDKSQLTSETVLWNPVYGDRPDDLDEKKPEELKGDSNYPGAYTLGDIKLWVENTGDYYSNTLGNPEGLDPGFMVSPANDEAFFINLPSTALPLQTISFSEKDDLSPIRYETNLEQYDQSTPFRVFYEVGVQNKILSNHYIDLTKIDGEYLASHKVSEDNEENSVYFLSNYYSEKTYDNYQSDSRLDRTIGDPVASYSPSSGDSYYFFKETKLLYSAGNGDDPKPDDLKATDPRFNEFINDTNLISVVSDIGAHTRDWFYVVFDYYELQDNNLAVKSQVAIPRRGSEFGSGIGGSGIKPGDCLCWFNPQTQDTSDFIYDNADTYGKPGDGYFIAAKQGTIRTGDLSQMIGTKGLPIGEDSTTSDKTIENTTRTAYNYFIPVIGSDSKTGQDQIKINNYLGNNGRIEVKDALLLITKKVVNDVDPEKTFDFDVTIDGYDDVKNAIKTEYDPYSNEWRVKISTIEIVTNNKGFIQTENENQAAVFGLKDGQYILLVNQNGQYYIYDQNTDDHLGDPYSSDLYYIYLKSDDSNNNVLVFNVQDNGIDRPGQGGKTVYVPVDAKVPEDTDDLKYLETTDPSEYGSIDFWAEHVYAIPKIDDQDLENWSFVESDPSYQEIKNFTVAHLDIENDNGLRSGTKLKSNYFIKTNLLTVPVTFDSGLANIELKDSEGLLFNGLESGTEYSVSEKIAQSDNIYDYRFDSVKQVKDQNYTVYTEDQDGSSQIEEYATFKNADSGITDIKKVDDLTGIDNTAEFGKDQFKVSGRIGAFEQAAHYKNKAPITGQHKFELTPGDKEVVGLGSEIEYQITWENITDQTADVVITDPLDPGVDFIDADNDGSYDEESHTVTWTFKDQPAYTNGEVTLKVKVNSKALIIDLVENTAFVKIGNNPEQQTETVENPIWIPEKTETDPGQGETVFIGSNVSYQITWKNYEEEPATVYVKDKLDPGVDFTQASIEDVLLIAGESTQTTQGDISIEYDSESHTVTWTLENIEPGLEGIVDLTVTVNKDALKYWDYSDQDFSQEENDYQILNQANVKVGDNPWVDTKIIDNPIWNPIKDEPDPGNGELVKPDQIVTYQIEWRNYKNQDAKILIEDTLDQNVSYVAESDAAFISTGENTFESIDYDFTETGSTLNWNLGEQPADSSGYIEFKVKVLNSALDVGKIQNQGSVQVDNDYYLTNIVENPTYSKNNLTIEKYHQTKNRSDWYTELNNVDKGQIVSYKLIVTNTGNITNHNVLLTDPIPETIVPIEDSYSGKITGNVKKSNSIFTPSVVTQNQKTTLDWNLGNMVPGEKIEITFDVRMPNNVLGTKYWINHAYVTYDEIATRGQYLKPLSKINDSDPIEILSYTQTDTLVSTEDSQDEIEPQTEDNTVDLLEGTDETEFELIEELSNQDPIELFQSNTSHVSTSITDSTDSNTIHSDLAPQDASVLYSEDVPETIETSPEIIIEKEQSTERHNIQGFSQENDGQRTKNYIEVKENDIDTYYLTVTNIGDATATNVIVTDTVPSGLTLVDNTITLSQMVTISGNTLTWRVGNLDPGESATVQFSVIVPGTNQQKQWTNTGYADYEENGDEPIPSNTVVIGEKPVTTSTTITNPTTPSNPTSSTTTTTNNSTSTTPSTTQTVQSKVSTVGVSPKTGIASTIALFTLVGLAAGGYLTHNTISSRKKDEERDNQ